MKVLVIDDDPSLVRATCKLLATWGYETCWSHDGERGLALMRTEAPDVVLLDMMLGPKSLTGWDVAREKLMDSRIRGIPLIVVSGMDPDDVRAGATVVANALAGTTLIFSKPVDTEMLHRALDHLKRVSDRPTDPAVTEGWEDDDEPPTGA